MKKLLVLILSLAIGLSLAACAQKPPANTDGSAEPQTPAANADNSPKPEESPVDADSDRAYVVDKGVMTIGYTVYEPMNYTDSDGNFTGFDTELAEIVCERLGVAPGFVEIDWNTKEVELAAKSIDCIWNGLTITPERQNEMSITVPYAKNAQVVVMKADAEYTDTSSLTGKAVCAEAGSAGEEAVTALLETVELIYVSKEVQTACLMEVAAGTSDAAVLDLTLANAMIGEGTDYSNLVIKDRLNVEDYGVAFRKGSDLCDAVNEIFAELVADGTMGQLAEKYNLDIN